MLRKGHRFQLMLGGCAIILLLSGCWDRTEINDVAFVLMTAIDKIDEEQYRYSAMIPLPGQMGGAQGGGGGTSGNKSFYIESETGRTVREAERKLQERMSRNLFHGHRRVIVFGERLAREGIALKFDYISRLPENRLSTFPVITKGEGLSLLETSPKLEMFPAEAIRELAKARGHIPVNLKDVVVSLGQTGSDPIIIYMEPKEVGEKENKSKEIAVRGYAQFREDRFVDIFENEAAEGLTLLNYKYPRYTTTTSGLKGEDITFHIANANTKIKPEIRNGVPHFTIRVTARIKLQTTHEELDFHTLYATKQTEHIFGRQIENSLHAAVTQMQRHGTDSAGFGMKFARRFPGEWRNTYKYKWEEHLKKATFEYHVNTYIAETGLTFENIVKKEGVNHP